jgi:hypothetical protein
MISPEYFYENYISHPSQAIKLYDEMIKKKKFIAYINLAHIQPTLTSIDDSTIMTGHKYVDGMIYEYFIVATIILLLF